MWRELKQEEKDFLLKIYQQGRKVLCFIPRLILALGKVLFVVVLYYIIRDVINSNYKYIFSYIIGFIGLFLFTQKLPKFLIGKFSYTREIDSINKGQALVYEATIKSFEKEHWVDHNYTYYVKVDCLINGTIKEIAVKTSSDTSVRKKVGEKIFIVSFEDYKEEFMWATDFVKF